MRRTVVIKFDMFAPEFVLKLPRRGAQPVGWLAVSRSSSLSYSPFAKCPKGLQKYPWTGSFR